MSLGKTFKKERTMADDFEKRMNALDDLANKRGQILFDNWRVILEYARVSEELDRVTEKARKNFGDEIASDDVVDKKTTEARVKLVLEDENKPKSKKKNPKRLTGLMKLSVLMAMMQWFDDKGTKTITLEDIEDWSKPSKDGSKKEVLREMGVGNINVKSTQFFQTKINDTFVRLYPDNAYVTKSAPFKSHFVVKTWNKWLKDNESKLAEGKQGSGVKS